jgi:hypothetical protein
VGVKADGDAEVGKLHLTVFGRENVGAFDVSVEDTLLVEVLQAMEHLFCLDDKGQGNDRENSY